MKMPFQQRIPNENEAERAEEWHRGLSLSTRNTCDALEEFLASDTIKVLELKGDWGIGKTYYFQNSLTWAKCKICWEGSGRIRMYHSLDLSPYPHWMHLYLHLMSLKGKGPTIGLPQHISQSRVSLTRLVKQLLAFVEPGSPLERRLLLLTA